MPFSSILNLILSRLPLVEMKSLAQVPYTHIHTYIYLCVTWECGVWCVCGVSVCVYMCVVYVCSINMLTMNINLFWFFGLNQYSKHLTHTYTHTSHITHTLHTLHTHHTHTHVHTEIQHTHHTHTQHHTHLEYKTECRENRTAE